MAAPHDEDLEVAILWLENNEGDPEGERASCIRVAHYLKELRIRREARLSGISVKYARKLIREHLYGEEI